MSLVYLGIVCANSCIISCKCNLFISNYNVVHKTYSNLLLVAMEVRVVCVCCVCVCAKVSETWRVTEQRLKGAGISSWGSSPMSVI